MKGYSWMMHEWLTDAILALGYRIGSEVFLFVFCFILFAWLFESIASYLTFHMPKVYAYSIVCVVFIVMFSHPEYGLGLITTRPQIISYLFFALLLMRTQLMKEGINWRDYAFVLLLMILWANLHGGGSLIGVAVLGGFSACEGILWLWRKKKDTREAILAFGLLLVAILGEMVNPYGYHLLVMSYYTITDPISKNITEWLPPVFNQWYMIVLLLLPFFLVLANRKRKLPGDLFNYLFMAFMLIQFFGAIRHMAMFGIAFLILFADHWEPVNEWIHKTYTFMREKNWIAEKLMIRTLSGFLIIIAVWTFWASIQAKANNLYDKFPVQAVEWMKQHHETGHVYNNYGWGGYLLFQGVPTFVDGRADIFMGSTYNHSNIFADYLASRNDVTVLNKVITEYHVERVLLSKESDKATISILTLDSHFTKVYEDKVAILYKKIS